MNNSEKEFLAVMLAAPASEIEALGPPSIAECRKELGLSNNEQWTSAHYLRLVAKKRRQWAQAMLKESQGLT